MPRSALRSPVRSSLLRRSLVVAALLAATSATSAHAATWGSFDASRMAYATGPLEGTVHGMLRGIIEANGDVVGPSTAELTPEYLETVDVFYTAMLSDGTGMTAGSVGTLSLDERAALQAWVASGGTLIVTPDSNGFDGPFPVVYDSWLSDYGVTDFAWTFSFATGNPVTPHPITDGIGNAYLDGYCTFTFPAEGEILATVDGGVEPYMVVFEPATGFAEGGRILVVGDHNAFTNTYIGEQANQPLAVNIVEWAAGECGNGIVEADEECDDGNLDDGDGCSSTCTGGGGGSTGDDGTGSDTGADDTAGSTGDPGTTTLPGDDGGSTDAGSVTGVDDGASQGGSEDGCGCTQRDGRASALLLPLLLVAGRRRAR